MLTPVKHKIYLNKILISLFRDSSLSASLGFKGGTAAYLFYHLPRFSVDLDFDLRLSGKTYSDKYLKSLLENIDNILSKDYEIREKSHKYRTLFWLLSYETGEQQIKVEISTREYPNSYVNFNYYGINIPVIKLGDMMAHKLCAITERKSLASRDLFDACYFLSLKEKNEINYEIIKIRSGMGAKEFYINLGKYLATLKKKNLLAGLGELIDNKQKYWVKNKMLSELIGQVEFMRDLYK